LLRKIKSNQHIKKPIIYGLAGTEILEEEKQFFQKSGPVGFILFARNIKNKQQVKKLVSSLKELMGGEVLILIDQEGGRVQRLKEPDWPKYPPAQYFADLYQKDKNLAKKECYENFSQISQDLAELGINVNCVPLLDVSTAQTHDVIGDRTLGKDIKRIIDLAQVVCDACLDNGVYPVIKHIPGHGRATCDSHLDLPIINADLEDLQKQDFAPFKALKEQKFAMSAHILYSRIDDKLPATISPKLIDSIRNEIGFKNILMSDDISMKALKNDVATNSKLALDAGCDLILHCNGKMKEMMAINNNLPPINDNLKEKL
jgi:beta-N-acetylhexosaminidase